jgi:hypothetical protein
VRVDPLRSTSGGGIRCRRFAYPGCHVEKDRGGCPDPDFGGMWYSGQKRTCPDKDERIRARATRCRSCGDTGAWGKTPVLAVLAAHKLALFAMEALPPNHRDLSLSARTAVGHGSTPQPAPAVPDLSRCSSRFPAALYPPLRHSKAYPMTMARGNSGQSLAYKSGQLQMLPTAVRDRGDPLWLAIERVWELRTGQSTQTE